MIKENIYEKLINEYKGKTSCPKCKKNVYVDLKGVIKGNPPKYETYCDICKEKFFVTALQVKFVKKEEE